MRKLLFTLTICFAAIPQLHAAREILWTPDTTFRYRGTTPFDRVVVVDARANRSGIGWLKTGAFNRYGTLDTDDSLDVSLSRYCNYVVSHSDHTPGELLVVLRNLWMEDRQNAEEIGTVHLRADLFRENGSGSYNHIRGLDTLYETKSGWDVTAGLKIMASEAIIDMLHVGAEPVEPDARFSRAEAIDRQPAMLRQWPAYTSAPVRGIYRNLNEFLQLQPGDTALIVQKIVSMEGPNLMHFYHPNAKGKKGKDVRRDSCFAVYDGADWYLSRRDGWSKMTFENGEYQAVQALLGLRDNSAMMGVLFGAVGTIIAAADQGKHYTRYMTRIDPEYRRFMPVRRVH